ncbi:hypothetical protein DYB36_001089 [Aphanomyces astaci]|uniref:Cation-transporting P-type ATPase N-terminal domain-containing protein n=1 Tax=Aphanomyces astaci TaxID=112090 RepID=A0A397ANW0_APHAT|nr:hypothetical protein DYB36_001089 [Aphanomyces astaci]
MASGPTYARESTPLLSASMRANEDRYYMGQDKRSLLNTAESGLSTVEAARRLKQFGPNELVDRTHKVSLGVKFLQQFGTPTAVLLWIAIAAEAATADIPDLAGLVFLQLVTAVVGWFEILKAENAATALKASLKPEAQVIRDGVHQTINAALLVPGDRVTLSGGCAVPADCDLCDQGGNHILVDEAMFTGETFPSMLGAGDTVKMGSLVTQGDTVEGIVSATGSQTFLGLVHASMPATYKQEAGLFRPMLVEITLVFSALALVLVGVCGGSLLVHGHSICDSIGFSVLLFLLSIPLSSSQVVSSSLAVGSRHLAEAKVLVTHATAIERLAALSLLYVDKTGSLTRNKMELQDELPIFAPHTTREDVLVMAALAAKWKEPPKDAIDTLVLNAIDLRPLDAYTLVNHRPLDNLKRTESTVRRPPPTKSTTNGSGKNDDERDDTCSRTFKVTKGAPHVLLSLCSNVDDAMREAVMSKVLELAMRGVRAIAVARTNPVTDGGISGGWVLLGLLTFVDPPRHDTKRTLELLHEHHVSVKMVTGDTRALAAESCRQLHLGPVVLTPSQCIDHPEYVEAADAVAEIDGPAKVKIVQLSQADGHVVGMTGLGDTASLRQANVGIAVDGATDAAKAAADVVLTKAGLSVLLHGIVLARQVCRRILTHVTYRVASSLHLLFFFVVAIGWRRRAVPRVTGLVQASTNTTSITSPSSEVEGEFSLPVIALVLLSLLNDGLLASVAPVDSVVASLQPPTWHPRRFGVYVGSLAIVSTGLSVVWLWWLLDNAASTTSSSTLTHLLQRLGLLDATSSTLSYGQVQMAMYLQLSLSDLGLYFSARATDGGLACLVTCPGKPLGLATALSAASATLLALFWPFQTMQRVSERLVAVTWVFVILGFGLQELAKGAAVGCLERVLPEADNSAEWQRRNRLALLHQHQAARQDGTLAIGLDSAVDRLARLDIELKAVRSVLQAASASCH